MKPHSGVTGRPPGDEETAVEQMTIGEFARATSLSPKALRLYDELGLLSPARIDEGSGYRYYDGHQLEQARLVSALRQLEMPLAQIQVILGLPPREAARAVTKFWEGADSDHSDRRELVTLLVNRLEGKRSSMPEVITRSMPERTLLCLKRKAEGEGDVWKLGKDFIAIMRERPAPRVDGPLGASFLIYHGEVNKDSDGPVEWCRPIPPDNLDEIAAQYPELTIRTEPAHEEAWVSMGRGGQMQPARWQVISDTLHSWVQEHARVPSWLGVRIVYEFSSPPAEEGPDCSFSMPLT
ncbi:MAG TPA: MerR family transcriptional regulator [Acidimicrobiales bacterium]